MGNDIVSKTFLVKFDSVQALINWVDHFLDIKLPMGHVDPDSNSSPAEWMWEAYRTYRDNEGNKVPGFIVLSSRDSYKTLTESILAVILMLHFGCTIAHLAAIESQASKAISYVNGFVEKIQEVAMGHGLTIDAQSKRKIALLDSKKNQAYVNVIIATMTGANSEHTNVFTIDEVDVMRFPKAYEEAQLIPVYDGKTGKFPMTIKTSTRKFAFGLMEKEIQGAKKARLKILRWNLIDITERCPEIRHRPDLPKEIRYIHSRLPLRNLSENEFYSVAKEKQSEYTKIEAYAGCASCELLPVCQMRLAHRPKTDVGGLFKPIDYTIGQFGKVSPDMGEAQLMCWKPSTTGLIYARFDDQEKKGNVLTINQAYESFTGIPAPATRDVTLKELTNALLSHGMRFYAGVDWGYRHAFAIVIGVLVGREFWLIDSIAIPGLEYEDMIKQAETFRDKYRVVKWFCDTAYPMNIAGFKRRKMPCPKFTKDIMGGIESIRGQIVDGLGGRQLKVISHIDNGFLINGFRNHHFKLNQAGDPTLEPDDEEYADIMDALRYMGQNLFKNKGKSMSVATPEQAMVVTPYRNPLVSEAQQTYNDFMQQKIRNLATEAGPDAKGKSTSGSVLWDMSDPTEPQDDQT